MTTLEQLENFIKNKRLLVVGGAPSASKKSKDWYDTFDVIVRCNNYKKINNDRTDVFYSYFGRNIKKTKEELLKDGVKFLINKCPNANMTKVLTNCDIQDKDYRWIYDLRKDWWFCPLISLTEQNLIRQIGFLDGYMPTVGFSAILFFSKYTKLDIIGFDCFESGIHNLNEKWDNSGNHNQDKEKQILLYLTQQRQIVWHK